MPIIVMLQITSVYCVPNVMEIGYPVVIQAMFIDDICISTISKVLQHTGKILYSD